MAEDNPLENNARLVDAGDNHEEKPPAPAAAANEQPKQIAVKGKVTKKGEDSGLPGATVVASHKQGEPILAKADDTGRYSLALEPGVWDLIAWHEGSSTAVAQSLDLTAAGTLPEQEHNIELADGVARFPVSGSVRWQDTGERVHGALVKATPKMTAQPNSESQHVWTNDDGDFSFNEGLALGNWEFIVLHERSLPADKPTSRMIAGATDPDLVIWRKEGRADARWGRYFFGGLCAGLVALVLLYLGLHVMYPADSGPEVQVLETQVDQARGHAMQTLDAPMPISSSTELAASVAVIRDSWQVISTTSGAIGVQDKIVIGDLIGGLEQAVHDNRSGEALDTLARLGRLAEPLGEPFWWTQPPLLFLEVLLWGLAGVLVYLIFRTGDFLRNHRFYVEGIYYHIAHLITVPILALVFVFLLSQVTLTVEISGASNVTLDLSDPRILAAVSFLIGVQPWRLYNFLLRTGSQLTGGGTQSGQGQSSQRDTTG